MHCCIDWDMAEGRWPWQCDNKQASPFWIQNAACSQNRIQGWWCGLDLERTICDKIATLNWSIILWINYHAGYLGIKILPHCDTVSSASIHEKQDQESLFIKEFADLLEQAATWTGQLIILGDFNIHWDADNDTEKRDLCNLLDTFGITLHVDGPTHTKGHTLDLVMVCAEEDSVSFCSISDFMSDHNAIFFTLNTSRLHSPRKTIIYQSFIPSTSQLSLLKFHPLHLQLPQHSQMMLKQYRPTMTPSWASLTNMHQRRVCLWLSIHPSHG